MTTMCSMPELLTLQALRLTGFADEEAIADRALLPLEEIVAVLDGASRSGHVETMSFADAHGLILTEDGQAHLATLLGRDVEGAGAQEVLATAIAEFERPGGINARFVETISTWQLRSTAEVQLDPGEGQMEGLETLLAELTLLGEQLRSVLAAVIGRLPRFGRYPAQYDIAMRRAHTEGLRWITGVGTLSCHAVWAELHQDLRSTAGRDRTPHPGSGR